MMKNSTLVYLIDDFISSGMRTYDLLDPAELLLDEFTTQYLDDIEIEPSEDLILKTLKQLTA